MGELRKIRENAKKAEKPKKEIKIMADVAKIIDGMKLIRAKLVYYQY